MLDGKNNSKGYRNEHEDIWPSGVSRHVYEEDSAQSNQGVTQTNTLLQEHSQKEAYLETGHELLKRTGNTILEPLQRWSTAA